MAASERWYFTKEQLANTPSRKCGTDADKELSYRQQSANFIQDMGQRLQVTQLCINTAIVYMHRFYMFHPFTKFHRNAISTCALFLAAKVEEQPRKLEHVIKVAHLCLHRDGPTLDTKTEAYLEQAHELVINENIMLQTLGFDIGIDHPHTYVVKCCQLVLASKDLAQTSYFMATNSLHLTTMCLQYKPTAVACVCIHLACKWSSWQIPRSSEGKEWFWYVDKEVTHEVLEELTSEFLAILDKCPSRLKRKIMSGKESQPIDKKPKIDIVPSSMMNSSGMDHDTDLESFLNSKEFLESQKEKDNSYPITPYNNNHSNSKPSPVVVASQPPAKPDTNSLAVSSPQVPLSSPSKKRAETLSLAAYREKKEKRRSDISQGGPPPALTKDNHLHNSHRKGDGETGKGAPSHHRSSHASQQEGSGERHKGRGHPEGFRADEKMSKVRIHHHHHHKGGGDSSNSLNDKVGPTSRSSDDADRKNTSAYRNDFLNDSASDDLKRLESLSSMMASVESTQPDDKKKNLTPWNKDEVTLSPALPPLPSSAEIMTATTTMTPNVPDITVTPPKPQKQSKHSKSKSPIAQQPSAQGNEGHARSSTHEKKSHKRKSPSKDHKDITNAKMEVPVAAVHLQSTPVSSKKERHKSDKRASVNQEGLKVKISLNKGEVKSSDTNHVNTTPPLPPAPPPPPALVSMNQPNLRMKINRKYLENNGKTLTPPLPPPPPPPKDVPEPKDKVKDTTKQMASSSNDKKTSLKLVISKDRLNPGSYGKKQDRESRKRERNSPKGHDPMRNSDGYQNKMSRMDNHSGRGGSRGSSGPPPPLIRGPPPQGHHYPSANGKADGYMTQQQLMMPYPQTQFYPSHNQQYFPYPGYPSQGLPEFLTNPPPPPPPPPPLLAPPSHGLPPLPRDPPPPPPPLPPE